jgi:aminoglycoside phosphotransferase (APT) family kinase protein
VLAEEGCFSALEARWLTSWLERLRPYLDEPVTPAFLHGDVQMSNVMVGSDLRFLALLDWGGAGWGDPAHDFAGVPLRAVPFMLEGYQQVWPEAMYEAMAGRILHRHLHLALFLLRRQPQPMRSWAERPQSMMLDVLRFFAERPQGIWARLY